MYFERDGNYANYTESNSTNKHSLCLNVYCRLVVNIIIT